MQLPFDLTAVLSSWPVSIFALGLVILLVLKRPLHSLIDRTRHVKLPGTELDAAEQRVEPPPTAAELVKREAERGPAPTMSARDAADNLLRNLPRTAYVTSVEDQLRQSLDGLGIGADAVQTARVLLTVSSISLTTATFEQLYNSIWGSQIKILQALNPGSPLSADDLKAFYAEAANQYPDAFAAYPFEQYLDFLIRQELIHRRPDGTFVITLKGRTFLTYLAHEGKSLARVL